MSKFNKKLKRYQALFKKINNPFDYLWKKAIGFDNYFEFDIKNFEKIKVQRQTMGPFRENFFDDIYLSRLPLMKFEKDSISVIDIGANIGFFSLALLARFPKARIFAFEPHPYCFEQLHIYKESFDSYNLNIYNKAVGGQNGQLILNTSKTDGFATMSSIFENENKQERFEVESVTLESVLEKEKLDMIDILKMDCEGSEYPIIYNTPDEVLKNIKSMCIETHQGTKNNENLHALVTFLEKKKYHVEYVDEGETGYVWAWK